MGSSSSSTCYFNNDHRAHIPDSIELNAPGQRPVKIIEDHEIEARDFWAKNAAEAYRPKE